MHKLDIILHPVRFRIIQCFLDGKHRTASKLKMELTDISQPTMYRHLDTLLKNDLLTVVEENQIRGTVEKVYALNAASLHLTNEDIKGLSKEEHLQYFLFFTAQLTKNFETYLNQNDFDFERDGVGYRQVALNLSDEELRAFGKEMRKIYEKYLTHQPSENRIKRLISTVILPDKEEKDE